LITSSADAEKPWLPEHKIGQFAHSTEPTWLIDSLNNAGLIRGPWRLLALRRVIVVAGRARALAASSGRWPRCPSSCAAVWKVRVIHFTTRPMAWGIAGEIAEGAEVVEDVLQRRFVSRRMRGFSGEGHVFGD